MSENTEERNLIQSFCASIAFNRYFEFAITGIIIVNSFLIGVQLSTDTYSIRLIQDFILYIFTIEIILRFFAATSLKSFFTDGWNLFDLSLVLIGYIPDTFFDNSSAIMAIRVLRVFRVLRLLRAAPELKLIVTVLVRSMSSMFYNLILFLIFVYLYAIIGVSLFRLPNPDTLTGQERIQYEQFLKKAPNSPGNSPDPFGNMGEASFTLFRALTGEDWTDLRYNLVTASEMGIVKINSVIITTYFVTWFCLSAFLLLNLVTGAIINNYQIAIAKKEEEKEAAKEMQKKGELLEA